MFEGRSMHSEWREPSPGELILVARRDSAIDVVPWKAHSLASQVGLVRLKPLSLNVCELGESEGVQEIPRVASPCETRPFAKMADIFVNIGSNVPRN
jgi:hypothetical protein